MNKPRYDLLPNFIQHRKTWLRQAKEEGLETLSRILQGNIMEAEELLKQQPKKIYEQLKMEL